MNDCYQYDLTQEELSQRQYSILYTFNTHEIPKIIYAYFLFLLCNNTINENKKLVKSIVLFKTLYGTNIKSQVILNRH